MVEAKKKEGDKQQIVIRQIWAQFRENSKEISRSEGLFPLHRLTVNTMNTCQCATHEGQLKGKANRRIIGLQLGNYSRQVRRDGGWMDNMATKSNK